MTSADLAMAGAPSVSNVTASQRQDGSKLVDIYYNASDPDPADVLHVYVQVSDNGGSTYSARCVSLTGDVGAAIVPGGGKHIVWNAANDIPGEYGENYRVRVTAWDSSLDTDPSHQMVFIPAGTFTMGLLGIATPEHEVTLDAFLIDRTEATNEEYARFVDAGGYLNPAYWPNNSITESSPLGWSLSPPYYDTNSSSNAPDEPVIVASWYEASAFCAWKGKRLPTEAEWERAARGASGRLFPWGGAAPTCELANHRTAAGTQQCYQNGTKVVIPVATLPAGATPEGIFDMAGNVWEWTANWPCRYTADATTNPRCDDSDDVVASGGSSGPPDYSAHRMRRGGSALDGVSNLRSAVRSTQHHRQRGTTGFRCVQSLN